MEITIEVPKKIIHLLNECNITDEEKQKEIFSKYLSDVIHQEYNQFFDDFDIWLNDETNEEILK